MSNLQAGLELMLSGYTPLFVVGGLVLGFLVGVLPGFSGANAAAIILPFSVAVSLEQGLILMAGIYAGASFAGAVPAILVNVPGTAGAAATALDGYQMTRQGRGGEAIGVARLASSLGGILGMTLILAFIGPMSSLALRFGSREMFLVAVIGILIIATVVGNNVRKGLTAALLGLLLAAMSASPVSGRPRFTFGFLELYDAVPFVPAIIGLFAIAQMLTLATQTSLVEEGEGDVSARAKGDAVWASAKQGIRTGLRYPKTIIRSSLLGTIIGLVPGAGTSSANFIAYSLAQQGSKDQDSFGKGNPEGVVASEACDNAVTGGTLVPTLTLGIPGSATAAIMLAALYLHGVQPGPRVMTTHGPEVYAVLISMLVASILILPVGILLASPLVLITKVKPAILVPTIIVLASIGTYAVRSQLFDVFLAGVFGLLGFAMTRHGYPVVPLILGMILGPIAENNLLRALNIANGRMGYFFDSPTALVLWGLIVLMLVAFVRKAVKARRRTVGPSPDRHGVSS